MVIDVERFDPAFQSRIVDGFEIGGEEMPQVRLGDLGVPGPEAEAAAVEAGQVLGLVARPHPLPIDVAHLATREKNVVDIQVAMNEAVLLPLEERAGAAGDEGLDVARQGSQLGIPVEEGAVLREDLAHLPRVEAARRSVEWAEARETARVELPQLAGMELQVATRPAGGRLSLHVAEHRKGVGQDGAGAVVVESLGPQSRRQQGEAGKLLLGGAGARRLTQSNPEDQLARVRLDQDVAMIFAFSQEGGAERLGPAGAERRAGLMDHLCDRRLEKLAAVAGCWFE